MLKRILMNAADGSPGGGQPPAPAQPAQPPAQSGVASITREDLQSFAQSVKDGVFADLRRAGVIGENKAKAKAKTESDGGEPAAQAAAPVDPLKMRSLDRAVARLGYKPDERAYSRMERDFAADSPTDPEGWVKDYFSGFGVATTQTTNQAAAPPPAGNTASTPHQTANGQPVTAQGGPPAPPKPPVDSLNLWHCSDADREAFIKAKGLKAYTTLLSQQGKGLKVQLK